jgi:hypothetical protein
MTDEKPTYQELLETFCNSFGHDDPRYTDHPGEAIYPFLKMFARFLGDVEQDLEVLSKFSKKLRNTYPMHAIKILVPEIQFWYQAVQRGIAFDNQPDKYPLPKHKEDYAQYIADLYSIEVSDIEILYYLQNISETAGKVMLKGKDIF